MSLGEQSVVVSNLLSELVNQRNQNVVDFVSRLGNVSVGRGDSVSNGGGQDIVVVGLEAPFLHFEVSLEL